MVNRRIRGYSGVQRSHNDSAEEIPVRGWAVPRAPPSSPSIPGEAPWQWTSPLRQQTPPPLVPMLPRHQESWDESVDSMVLDYTLDPPPVPQNSRNLVQWSPEHYSPQAVLNSRIFLSDSRANRPTYRSMYQRRPRYINPNIQNPPVRRNILPELEEVGRPRTALTPTQYQQISDVINTSLAQSPPTSPRTRTSRQSSEFGRVTRPSSPTGSPRMSPRVRAQLVRDIGAIIGNNMPLRSPASPSSPRSPRSASPRSRYPGTLAFGTPPRHSPSENVERSSPPRQPPSEDDGRWSPFFGSRVTNYTPEQLEQLAINLQLLVPIEDGPEDQNDSLDLQPTTDDALWDLEPAGDGFLEPGAGGTRGLNESWVYEPGAVGTGGLNELWLNEPGAEGGTRAQNESWVYEPGAEGGTRAQNESWVYEPGAEGGTRAQNESWVYEPGAEDRIDVLNRTHEIEPTVEDRIDALNRTHEIEPTVEDRIDALNRTHEIEPTVEDRIDALNRTYGIEPTVEDRIDALNRTYEIEPTVEDRIDDLNRTYGIEPSVEDRIDDLNRTYRIEPSVEDRIDDLNRTYGIEPSVEDGVDALNQTYGIESSVEDGVDAQNERRLTRGLSCRRRLVFGDSPGARQQDAAIMMQNLITKLNQHILEQQSARSGGSGTPQQDISYVRTGPTRSRRRGHFTTSTPVKTNKRRLETTGTPRWWHGIGGFGTPVRSNERRHDLTRSDRVSGLRRATPDTTYETSQSSIRSDRVSGMRRATPDRTFGTPQSSPRSDRVSGFRRATPDSTLGTPQSSPRSAATGRIKRFPPDIYKGKQRTKKWVPRKFDKSNRDELRRGVLTKSYLRARDSLSPQLRSNERHESTMDSSRISRNVTGGLSPSLLEQSDRVSGFRRATPDRTFGTPQSSPRSDRVSGFRRATPDRTYETPQSSPRSDRVLDRGFIRATPDRTYETPQSSPRSDRVSGFRRATPDRTYDTPQSSIRKASSNFEEVTGLELDPSKHNFELSKRHILRQLDHVNQNSELYKNRIRRAQEELLQKKALNAEAENIMNMYIALCMECETKVTKYKALMSDLQIALEVVKRLTEEFGGPVPEDPHEELFKQQEKSLEYVRIINELRERYEAIVDSEAECYRIVEEMDRHYKDRVAPFEERYQEARHHTLRNMLLLQIVRDNKAKIRFDIVQEKHNGNWYLEHSKKENTKRKQLKKSLNDIMEQVNLAKQHMGLDVFPISEDGSLFNSLNEEISQLILNVRDQIRFRNYILGGDSIVDRTPYIMKVLKRYLRAKSYRKALKWQKKFLISALKNCEDSGEYVHYGFEKRKFNARGYWRVAVTVITAIYRARNMALNRDKKHELAVETIERAVVDI